MGWKNIHGVRKKQAKGLEAGAPKWSDPAMAERVLSALAQADEPPLDLEVDAHGAALTGSKYWFEYRPGDKSRWPDWMERWSGDLAFATRALFRCATLLADDSEDDIHVRACDAPDGLANIGPWPFTFLRDAIAKSKKSDAAKVAKELAPNAPLALRFMLAYVFPKEGFARGELDWGLRATAEESDGAILMAYALAIAGDEKVTASAAKAQSGWDAWRELAEHLDDVVRELDPARALALVRLTMLDGWGSSMAEEANALVAIAPSEAVARVAAELLGNHHAGAVLRPWLAKHPELAIPALADRIAALRVKDRRAAPMAATSLLQMLTLANRSIAERALAARKSDALAHALEVSAPLPDADARDLPPALAAPPWRAPAKKSEAAPYEALSPLAYKERIVWEDDEARANMLASAFRKPDKPPTKSSDAALMTKLERERKKEEVFFFELGELSDSAAFDLLEKWSASDFRYYDRADVAGILGRFGIDGLPAAMRFAVSKPDTLDGLARVDSPRVAPIMARAAVELKKKKDIGEAWLARFPESAAIGLFPELSKRKSKELATIEEALRLVAREAPDVARSIAKRYGAEKSLDAVLASSSFAKLPKKLPKMPKFWDAKGLPRPRLEGGKKALPLAAVEDLGMYLALSKRDAYHPALFAIRAACDRASLARFAWALFSEWLGSGADTKFDFGFFVLGVFGDDDAARALQPMIKAWAPGGFPTRAQMGVDVLAALGTHAALEQVYKTATKVRSKALAAHAEKTLEKIATRLRLSRDDLADRLVPDLDVDERGARTFDYGTRRFVVRFDEHLKPYVDAGGKRLDNLPKPVPSDDEEEAAQAIASFKELKKRAREVIAEQTKRLEQSLSSRRKWERKTFEERFVDHPLLRMLGARLVWGAYESGRLGGTFRLDDGARVDADGRAFELREGHAIGLVHPAELDEKSRARWSDVLAEHRFIQPITQLGRDVFPPDDALVKRASGAKVESTKLLGLERRGWKRGPSPQGGVFSSYEKAFGDLRATIAFDPGIQLGDPKEEPIQTIEAVTLFRGKIAATLRELDVALASEIAMDVAAITRP